MTGSQHGKRDSGRIRVRGNWIGSVGVFALLALLLLLSACSNGTGSSGGQPGSTTGNNNSTSTAQSPTAGGGTTTTPSASNTPGATPTIASSVWAQLESKPLHLPTVAPGGACPTTAIRQNVSPDYADVLGAGPVYVRAENASSTVNFVSAASMGDPNSGWGGTKVYWQIQPSYTGPVLIRGQQVDGSHGVRFNGGLGQTTSNPEGTEPLLTTLQLQGGGNTAPSWPTWVAFTRLQASGCYAYQVDGLTFSEVIVFQAVAQP